MKNRRDLIYLSVIVVLLGLCGQFYYTYRYTPEKQRHISVHYNRDIRANEEIIRAVQNADKFVYFAIYTFTRADIKDALLGAKHRGLDVQGVTDAGQTEQSDLQAKLVKELRNAGIPVGVQDHSALMHVKALVTDKSYVSGSYNWTAAATDTNDELLETGADETVRSQYEKVLKKIVDKYQNE